MVLMEGLKFTKSRFILCEGDDDKGFLETIIKERNLPEFQVCHAAEFNPQRAGGRSGFVKALEGIEPLLGFSTILRAILIVTDNDRLESSFRHTQQALISNNYTPPPSPRGVGMIADKPVAILMIPSNDTQGDFESLCLPAIFDKWPNAERCVTDFMNCTGASGWTKQASISKARARAAAVGFNEDDPYKGIGHLFRNGTFSTLHPCFNGIADFLRNFDTMVGI
jgi:hypothetical protein